MKKARIHRMHASIKKKLVFFFGQFPHKDFVKGEKVIFSDDAKVPLVYFIERGYVRQGFVTEGGEDVTVHIFKENAYFPMVQILTRYENIFVFDALNSVRVRVAPKEDVISFLKKEPDVLFDLTVRLSSGLIYLSESLSRLLFVCARERITYFFSMYARRFGMENGNNSIIIPFILKHKDIADSVGLTRETVTRELKKMEREKKLWKKGHFYVLSDRF